MSRAEQWFICEEKTAYRGLVKGKTTHKFSKIIIICHCFTDSWNSMKLKQELCFVYLVFSYNRLSTETNGIK